MNLRFLLREPEALGVWLTTNGETLQVDAPAGVLTAQHREALAENKPALLQLLTARQQRLFRADRQGLIIQYAREPGWIALHDPTTGEWNEVREKECLSGVVESAKHRRRSTRGGAT